MEPLNPAGGLYSTAIDMTKYIEYQLTNLKSDTASNLTTMFDRIMPLPVYHSKFRPKTDFPSIAVAYGLGWNEWAYRGKLY